MRIFELDINDPRSQAVVQNTMVVDLKKNYGDALAAWDKGIHVYKGMKTYFSDSSEGNFYKTDPKLSTRKSRNTTNHYTILMDNLPVWSAYPKRSKSLVCSTDYWVASGYGRIYAIIPKQGAVFGVCSRSDLWSSFWNNDYSLETFNRMFEDIPCPSYTEFLQGVLANQTEIAKRFLASTELYGILEADSLVSDMFATFINQIKVAQNTIDIQNAFSGLMDPKANNFRLSDISSLPGEGHEVWTDSEAYLLDPTKLGLLKQSGKI